MIASRFARKQVALLISLAFSPVLAHSAVEDAAAAVSGPVATVVISAKSGDYLGTQTAAAVAPTQSSMDATQPQSIITRDFIELSVTPTAEYSRIVNIAPSLSGDSSNGPGLSETKTTMRGFSDDQYNITFDGIPWGDTNNPAHHSTSFFPGTVIGGAIVERGPGNADNLGFATFGGSINLFSKKPLREQKFSVYGSAGTWHTTLAGAAYESGQLAGFGNGTVQFNAQRLNSDGYLTLNRIKSDNFMIKVRRPVGEDTVLTLFASYNRIGYVQPDNSKGPTLAQVAQYGKNFGLNDDPTSFNYAGYNHTDKTTDFSYLRSQTTWGTGWTSDNQLYTYSYDNETISSTDPTGAAAPGTKVGGVGNKNIPGIDKRNKYRVTGDILRLNKELDAGIVRGGLWYEYSHTDRHQYDLDLTLGLRDPRETKPTPLQAPSVLFDQQSTIRNVQPFVQFEWAATPSLTLTPGLKYVQITRAVDADINQTTRLPQHTSLEYSATLPFLTANQKLSNQLAVYAQYAKGFQVPDLKSFYIADPSKNSSDPQKSVNYQLGMVGDAAALTWDVDVYKIDFTNKYVSNGLSGADAAFINVGGATYKGIEAQATWLVGGGVALYANGSKNKATASDTGKTIANAPDLTAALGLLYKNGPWAASLIGKRTGETRQLDYDPAKPAAYDAYLVGGYTNTDLSVAYRFLKPGAGISMLKLQLNVFNLANKQSITSISAGKTVPFDQYTFQAARSFQVSARAEF